MKCGAAGLLASPAADLTIQTSDLVHIDFPIFMTWDHPKDWIDDGTDNRYTSCNFIFSGLLLNYLPKIYFLAKDWISSRNLRKPCSAQYGRS